MKKHILFALVPVVCATSLFGAGEWHEVRAGKQNNNKVFIDAVYRNDIGTLYKLLPSVSNHAKGIALVHAIQCNNIGLSNYLLRSGAEVGVRNEDGRTTLMLASYKGLTFLIDSLLSYGASVDERDYQGSTALMHAASGGHVEAVRRLINAGANVNLCDKFKGRTPLHWALRMREGSAQKKGHLNSSENVLRILDVLLRSGACIYIKDKEYRRTPIDWAEEMNWRAELKLMKEYAHSNAQK